MRVFIDHRSVRDVSRARGVRHTRLFATAAAGLVALALPAAGAMSPAAEPADAQVRNQAANKVQISQSLGRLPLSFETNQGQANKQVKFISRGAGYSLSLTGSSAILALSHAAPGKGTVAQSAAETTDAVTMELVGASAQSRVAGDRKLPGVVNYLVGHDPSQWRTGIPTYARVAYTSVYPGVDLVYYGNQGQLEYDFIVAPGATPETIRLHFAGAKRLTLNAAGNLAIRTAHGEIAFHKPEIYQQAGARRTTVEGRFILVDSKSVGFSVGRYNHTQPLVIDPSLAYSTYLGGLAEVGGDEPYAIAVDTTGNAYIAGMTGSLNYPVTGGALQSADPSAQVNGVGTPTIEGFLSKLNPSGTALLYSTYIGGFDGASANGVALDRSGNIYVTGITSGLLQFPYAVNVNPKASAGIFVLKLNPSGNTLVYGILVGGTEGVSIPAGIALDSVGSAYVAGATNDVDFPTTAGGYQTIFPGISGESAGFAFKVNPGGTALVYSTFLGSAGGDTSIFALGIDRAGSAFMTGQTSSSSFPVTSGAFQKTKKTPSARGTGFVTELNASGTGLVYSTYLGGSVNDQANTLAVDGSDNVYVGGETSSPDFPVTNGAFQTTNAVAAIPYLINSVTGFVTKLNSAGSALSYSTFLGGNFEDRVLALAIDASGKTYLGGATSSPNFPVTAGAFQSANTSSEGTGFVAQLDPTGSGLLFSSYLGGSNGDWVSCIALDTNNNPYLAGWGSSRDFPITGGAFQKTNAALGNEVTGFVVKVAMNLAGTTMELTSNIGSQVPGQPVTFTAQVAGAGTTAVPTGSVNFTIDGALSQVEPLIGGQASYTTSSLSLGFHTIQAYYEGGGNFGAGTLHTWFQEIAYPVAATPVFSPAPGGYLSAQSVTIGDSTAGAAIYYTTDGTTPTTGSTRYVSPIPVTAASTAGGGETIRAIAVASFYQTSAVAAGAYAINAAATPTFLPGAGAFGAPQTVTIGDATPGATIYYTTDGSKPTTSSTRYTAPISVSASETFTAMAVASGMGQSFSASSAYQILAGPPAPTFSPAAGAYNSAQTVTIASATPGAAIYYSTNGTTPSASSNPYTGPITVASNQTIKAAAWASEPGSGGYFYVEGAVATAAYTIPAAAATFSPAAGVYTSAQTLTIASTTTGATIYYTTDGSAPTTSSTSYTGPITVNASETIEAIAVAPGYTTSSVSSAKYTFNLTAPTFSPAAGEYTSAQTVTIASTYAGAAIYYITNGSTPTTSSTRYTGPVTVNASETIEAIAVAPGYTTSSVSSAKYTFNLTAPTFSPAAGTYASAQTVTIASTHTGAAIYYTTNGSTPTTSSTPYTGPIAVSASETVEAIAVASGYTTSPVATAAYDINPAAGPVFSPAAGAYGTPQTVTIGDATSGATIYYTTDGSTPTPSSTLYTGPISVSASETITAVAVATGRGLSAAASASYQIVAGPPAPAFSPAGGAYTSVQSVTITDATSTASIHYTTDGTTPSASSTLYTGPITVSSNQTIKAVAWAVEPGVGGSFNVGGPVATAVYTIAGVAATPTIAPASGTYYTASQTVTIGDATPGATIYYTTNGATPTTSSPAYTGPISISASETITAIAEASGTGLSAAASSIYRIAPPAPTFSPAGGPYATPQEVTISDAASGTPIYYTTDGTMPSLASSRYTGPITVSSSQMVKAAAWGTAPGSMGTVPLAGAVGTAMYAIMPAGSKMPPLMPMESSPKSGQ